MVYSVIVHMLFSITAILSLLDVIQNSKRLFTEDMDILLISIMIVPQLIIPVISWFQTNSQQEYLNKWVVLQVIITLLIYLFILFILIFHEFIIKNKFLIRNLFIIRIKMYTKKKLLICLQLLIYSILQYSLVIFIFRTCSIVLLAIIFRNYQSYNHQP